MFKKLFAILFAFISTVSFAQSQSSTAINENIRSVLIRQKDCWNEGNIDGYMQGYWKSDSLLFTSGGKIQRGWQATFEKYKKSYNTKAKMGKLYFSQLEVNLLSPEAAWIFGRWELKREKDNPKGVFTLILRKFSDGWKIIHDHTASQ
jgi:ketosteroid isomerase-like protein